MIPVLASRFRAVVVLVLALILWAAPVCAGQVEWREVPSSGEGQQWWDAGSLRLKKDGTVSVLSRYSLRQEDDRPALGTLVVMEIDCSQQLYRDKQKNGLPQFKAEWQPSGSDPLIDGVLSGVCSSDELSALS
ncbi:MULTISPECIES: hypothetical protein [unclassified Synechococcus]|jgi:hypothetical protein|uniref:hypothetical protein n=1 Tax=unclassified Synechococcus TaxID=2626047 RepID=UPI00022D8E12|nr:MULTISPECIES: hypothetical protein [unclassified Synechococcus]EHA63875.1 hypothetical protein Syn8016DRAFT_0917 [Synechococcus sp. WH 8016]NKB73876.1 hypothetical protein [Synechococcus sp. s2_metabat2_7]